MQTCPASVFNFSDFRGHLLGTAESPAYWSLRRPVMKIVNEPGAEKVDLESCKHPPRT